eukprot:3040758-Amphidinium_carterae.1
MTCTTLDPTQIRLKDPQQHQTQREVLHCVLPQWQRVPAVHTGKTLCASRQRLCTSGPVDPAFAPGW